MERIGDRYGKMEGYCSTDQSPQWVVVPMEEEEEEEEETQNLNHYHTQSPDSSSELHVILASTC